MKIQGLAGVFGIQGIPAVKLFKDGDLASEFTGALPEPMLREFLSKFLPTAADKEADEAAEPRSRAEKPPRPKRSTRRFSTSDPNHAKALLGLGRLAMNEGDNDAALEHLRENFSRRRRAQGSGSFDCPAQAAGRRGGRTEAPCEKKSRPSRTISRRASSWPKRLPARKSMKKRSRSFSHIVKTDRNFQDDGARKAMIQIFEVLAPDDPLTDKYRSELAKVLFSLLTIVITENRSHSAGIAGASALSAWQGQR